jgi:hypothetical protein
MLWCLPRVAVAGRGWDCGGPPWVGTCTVVFYLSGFKFLSTNNPEEIRGIVGCIQFNTSPSKMENDLIPPGDRVLPSPARSAGRVSYGPHLIASRRSPFFPMSLPFCTRDRATLPQPPTPWATSPEAQRLRRTPVPLPIAVAQPPHTPSPVPMDTLAARPRSRRRATIGSRCHAARPSSGYRPGVAARSWTTACCFSSVSPRTSLRLNALDLVSRRALPRPCRRRYHDPAAESQAPIPAPRLPAAISAAGERSKDARHRVPWIPSATHPTP